MQEISNRTLATMLVIAIILSLVGTLISLDRIGKLGGVTGLVTVNQTESTGTTTLTVVANAEITLRVETVAFGSWRINGSTTTKNCTLASKINLSTNAGNNFTLFEFFNGTGATTGADCIFISTAGFTQPHSFELENTGNTLFTNVTINASKNGSSGGEPSSSTYDFLINETGDILNYRVMEEGNACSDTNAAIPGSNGSSGLISTNNATVCKQFNFTDSQDAIVVQVNITLPSTTQAQAATNTITFKAYAFGPI